MTAPQTTRPTFRYREASEDNRTILSGLTVYDDRHKFVDYLREVEWTTFTPRPVEHETFRQLMDSDAELRAMLEREDDPVLVAELLCRRYPTLFFSIDHVFQIYTDWKLQYTKKVPRVDGRFNDPFSIPDTLLEDVADPVLEMLARRWFRKEIKHLNENPKQAVEALKKRLAEEKDGQQRKLLRHLLKLIQSFLRMRYPVFVKELLPGKPFPSIHVRLWIQQILEKGNALIVGDVGTQKTSASVIGMEMLGCGAVVVCCRSYAKLMWRTEIRRYYREPINPFIVDSVEELKALERMKPEDLRMHRFIIVGYGNVQVGHTDIDDENQNAYGDRIVDALIRLKPDGIIVDEAHAIKGKGTRSQRVLRIAQAKSVRHRIMLTATPFENRPNEVAHLATLLSPKQYPVPQAFLASCQDNPRIFFVTMTRLMCDYFAQEDVLELPTTNLSIYGFFPTVELDCPPDMQRVLETIQQDGSMEARQQVNTMIRFLAVPLALRKKYKALRGLPCFQSLLHNPKLTYLREEVTRRIKTGKVVIASGIYAVGITRPFEEEHDLKDIASLFEEWFPGQVLTIDGATLSEGRDGRQDVQERWQTDPEARILIASVPATSESLNFTLKRVPGKVEKVTVYYLNLPWKPTQYLQFNGRFRRPGTEVPMEVYALVLKGTADEALVALNERKWRNFLIGVHGIPLQTEEEEALNRATFLKIVTTPAKWLTEIFHRLFGVGEEKMLSILDGSFRDLPVAETAARYYLLTEEFGVSGHISRVVAPALTAWHTDGVIPSWDAVLDVGPGPLVLERKLEAPLPSIEINPMMIEVGAAHSVHAGKNAIRGRASQLPSEWSGRFSFLVASLVLDLTSRRATVGTGKEKEIERVRVLREFHRVLVPGGLLWFTFQERCFNHDTLDAFVEALRAFGFEVVHPWTNRIQATDHAKQPFAFWSVLVRKARPVAAGTLPCPRFLQEQALEGAQVVKGARRPKAPRPAVQLDLLKHEQFAICGRDGSLVSVTNATKQVTPPVDTERLYTAIAKQFSIADGTKASKELRKHIVRVQPRSKTGLKEVWRSIRDLPGVPRVSWAQLSKALHPHLSAP